MNDFLGMAENQGCGWPPGCLVRPDKFAGGKGAGRSSTLRDCSALRLVREWQISQIGKLTEVT